MTDALADQALVPETEDRLRRSRFPAGAALSFEDIELAGHEHVLDALREAEPVTWAPAIGGWFITGREAARSVLSPRSTTTVEVNENLVRASLGKMMLTVDFDEHHVLRKPFEQPFKLASVADTFGSVISDEADALIDGFLPDGAGEFGSIFAAPFAVRMAGRMLGLSFEDTEQIDRMYAAFAAAMVYDGNPEPLQHADAARTELNEILLRQIRDARVAPNSSITSQVANAPDGLDDDEIAAQLRVIMFGAVETIQASLMNTLLLLFEHPESLARVLADHELIPGAVEEAIRLIPPVAFIERWTSESTAVGDVDVPQGEFIGISVVAANRDPETFADPLRFDIERENAARALSFSFGIHACLGVHLARLETSIALSRIFERLPEMSLYSYEPPSGFAFRRPPTLHLSWATSG